MNEESVENPRGRRANVSIANFSLDPNNFRIVDNPDYQQLYLSAVKIRVESRRERIVEGPFSSASAAGLQDLGGLFSCVPFFSVFRSVRLLGVRGSAESMESLWTILIRAISRFRVRVPD